MASEEEHGQINVTLAENLLYGLAQSSACHLVVSHSPTVKVGATIVIPLQQQAEDIGIGNATM
jgi:hypothetical protein